MSNLPTPAPIVAPLPAPKVEAKVSTLNTKAKKKTFMFPYVGKSVQAGSQEEANLLITKTDEYANFMKKEETTK